MSKTTNDNIKEKLKYIGLDLNNIPTFLKTFTELDFRPDRNLDETKYRVYKYLDVKDIQILLTPTNRLMEINEKYRKSSSSFFLSRAKNRSRYRKTY